MQTTPTEPSIPPGLSHAKTTSKILSLIEPQQMAGKRVLDLGAGHGYFTSQLWAHLEVAGIDPSPILSACDLYPEGYAFSKVSCTRADLANKLPYDDASFDLVICMEVIEHLTNQSHLIREIARIVKPGGRAIISTPNILNAAGRFRYLFTGTWPLFDIMPIDQPEVTNVAGHIAPIHLYYMFYFARMAGFTKVRFDVDRTKKSAALLALLLYPYTLIGHGILNRRRKLEPFFTENLSVLGFLNSWPTLTGRTIIMEAVKGGK